MRLSANAVTEPQQDVRVVCVLVSLVAKQVLRSKSLSKCFNPIPSHPIDQVLLRREDLWKTGFDWKGQALKNATDRDRDTIIAMLGQYRAAQETLLRSEARGSGNPHLMPKTWTQDMRELERCLSRLAYQKPLNHRHVMARHVDPLIARRVMVGKIRNHGAQQVMVWPQLGPCSSVLTSAKLPEHKGTSTYTCLVASWPGWVNKPTVERGIDLLVSWFEPPNEAVGPAQPLEMIAA